MPERAEMLVSTSSFEIKTYRIWLWKGIKSPWGDDLVPTFPAIIYSAGEPNQILNIIFCSGYEVLPANIVNIIDSNILASLYIPSEQFQWYIDTLRNEKPVYALIFEEPEAIIVSTSEEPVGEGERKILNRFIIP